MKPSWCWAGARAIGTAHLESGTPCQDAFAVYALRLASGSEVLVASLADGAGSAERADAGARLATSVSVEVVAEALAEGAADVKDAAALLRFAAEQARLAVAALAGHEEQPVTISALTAENVRITLEESRRGRTGRERTGPRTTMRDPGMTTAAAAMETAPAMEEPAMVVEPPPTMTRPQPQSEVLDPWGN